MSGHERDRTFATRCPPRSPHRRAHSCYNEAVAIGRVVPTSEARCQATVYVYDNNSTDETWWWRASWRGRALDDPAGKGNVIRRMFADMEADIYVLVDGDGTYECERRPGSSIVAQRRSRMVDATRTPRILSTPGTVWQQALTGLLANIFGNRLHRHAVGLPRVFPAVRQILPCLAQVSKSRLNSRCTRSS